MEVLRAEKKVTTLQSVLVKLTFKLADSVVRGFHPQSHPASPSWHPFPDNLSPFEVHWEIAAVVDLLSEQANYPGHICFPLSP